MERIVEPLGEFETGSVGVKIGQRRQEQAACAKHARGHWLVEFAII